MILSEFHYAPREVRRPVLLPLQQDQLSLLPVDRLSLLPVGRLPLIPVGRLSLLPVDRLSLLPVDQLPDLLQDLLPGKLLHLFDLNLPSLLLGRWFSCHPECICYVVNVLYSVYARNKDFVNFIFYYRVIKICTS